MTRKTATWPVSPNAKLTPRVPIQTPRLPEVGRINADSYVYQQEPTMGILALILTCLTTLYLVIVIAKPEWFA